MSVGRVRVGPQHYLTPLGVFEGSQWRVRTAQIGSRRPLEGQRIHLCPNFTPKNALFSTGHERCNVGERRCLGHVRHWMVRESEFLTANNLPDAWVAEKGRFGHSELTIPISLDGICTRLRTG